MDKLDKYIDDLFHQEFSGAGTAVPPSGADWSQLSKVIRKKNFLRFSTGSFNVYYLTAIVATVTTIGSFVLPNMIGNDKNDTINTPSTIQVLDTLPKADTITDSADSIIIFKIDTLRSNRNNLKSDNQLKEENPVKANSVQTVEEKKVDEKFENFEKNVDTLRKAPEINQPENGGKIERQNTQCEIVPGDTIIRTDTVRILKKGIQVKRKKSIF
jgi:hypothetical protein